MLIESIGTSLVVGKIRGGSFANMKEAEVHKWYLFVGAFAVEFATVYMAAKGFLFFEENIGYIHFTCYVLLLTGAFFNRKQKGFGIVFLGIFLNFAVIAANGGHMPVSPEGMMRAGLAENLRMIQAGKIVTHTVLNENTLLGFLGDIWILPKPYPRPKIFSIGDAVMAVGLFLYIQDIMIKKEKAENENIAA